MHVLLSILLLSLVGCGQPQSDREFEAPRTDEVNPTSYMTCRFTTYRGPRHQKSFKQGIKDTKTYTASYSDKKEIVEEYTFNGTSLSLEISWKDSEKGVQPALAKFEFEPNDRRVIVYNVLGEEVFRNPVTCEAPAEEEMVNL